MTIFEKNIKELRAAFEAMADKIENEEKPDEITLSGDVGFIVNKGISIPLCGTGDPDATARKIAKENTYLKGDVTVVIGAGLGHVVNAIMNRKKSGHFVIVVEPVVYLVREMLSRFDLSKQIKRGEIMFVIDNDDIIPAITYLENIYVIENWRSLMSGYCAAVPTKYAEPIKRIQDAINSIYCNTGTIMGAGYQIAKNDIENLPYILPHRGVKDLADLFKGKPVVMVSTGPSLAKNIWRLKKYQDKVIIVAVAQALRTLLAYGIRPDFITTVDFGEVNYSHFSGLMDQDVPLVCLNRSWAKILKQYRGPKFIAGTWTPGFEETSAGLSGRKGHLEQGGSVAHFTLALASTLGCDPIIIIGQDLSLTESSHIPTVDSGGEIEVKDGMIYWHPKDHKSSLGTNTVFQGPAQYVRGYFGNPVLTNIGLQSFITTFEHIIKSIVSAGKKVINSTEGGAHLIGGERMALKDALKEYARRKIDKSGLIELSTTEDPEKDALIEEAIPILKNDIRIIDAIIKNCKQGLNSNIAMDKERKKGKKKNEAALRKHLAENEEASTAAHDAAKKNNLVTMYIFHASREIATRALKVKGKVNHLLKNDDDFQTRIARNRLILEAANKAAKELKPLYKEALSILEQYAETKDESLFTEPAPPYELTMEDVEKYLAAGNWAIPLVAGKAVKAAEEMRDASINQWKNWNPSDEIRYIELVEKAQEIGFKEKDFKAAEGILEEAVRILPDRPEALWGLATTYHHNRKTEKALKKYRKLVKMFPDVHKYRFEMGLATLTIKPLEGIKIITEAMKDTNAYDYFFNQIGKIYLQVGKREEAAEAFREYLKRFPEDEIVKEQLKKCEGKVNL